MQAIKYISSTGASVAPTTGMIYTSIQVLQDTQFHTLTPSDGFSFTKSEGTGKIASTTQSECITVFAGQIIYGRFSAIQLHTGALLAYMGY